MDGTTPVKNLPLAILWRRKWTVLLTVVAVVLVTEGVTKTLTPIYKTTATLIVSSPGQAQSFEISQANEELARSYAQILASPNFAAQVASQVGGGTTGSSIQSATSIDSVASTQLITITAESSSPRRAQAIATAYAALTVRYAPTLQPQTKASVSQASPAALPTSPSQPKPLLYGLAAALLGLAAGIAFAFARERFDVRLRSVDDIASHLGLPILADIPLRTSNPRSISQFAEGFKLLRTNLQFLDQTMSTRTIAVTSWNEGEGKTTVTSQLAISLATSGTATLAVDGDIYRPGLHAALTDGRADSEVPGFSDYLADSTPIEELALETRIETLAILPAGSRVSGLSTLLNSRAGRAAIAKLSNRFDAGVIDCPPLVAGADAPALAARADGVILVVDLSRASKTSLDAAKQRLEAVNAVILGVAVNRDRSRSDGSYYYYRDENGARPWRNRLGTRARDLIR